MERITLYTNTVMRVLLGLIFIIHGLFKIEWGYANLAAWLHDQGFPLAGLCAYVLPWVELLGGIALIIGIGSRYIALIFSLLLLVALLTVKLQAGFLSSTQTGYEFDLILLVVSIHVAATTSNSLSQTWSSLPIFHRSTTP
jgi:putative oxidoreductase